MHLFLLCFEAEAERNHLIFCCCIANLMQIFEILHFIRNRAEGEAVTPEFPYLFSSPFNLISIAMLYSKPFKSQCCGSVRFLTGFNPSSRMNTDQLWIHVRISLYV
jgi:hypothetical protein